MHYITKEQHDNAINQRLSIDYDNSKTAYNRIIKETFGEYNAWDKLNAKEKAYLMDFEYNVKGGVATFPNLMKAMFKKDVEAIKNESLRYEIKRDKMEMSFQKNLLEETRKCLKELKNCILISFCCLVFVGCNNKTNHANTINNTDFTAEELEMIRQNDSAFKAFIINAKQLRDSIKCAYIENDHDKAAASQYLLLRSGDNYYDLTCHYQAMIIFSHEFDSMAVWFPVEDAILKKHWLVEAEE